jgi:acyl-CoA thioester hydrolase
MAKLDFKFAHTLRVRWAEVDIQGIVFNGHYLMYFDVAITEYWRAIGLRYPDQLMAQGNCDLYVVKSTIEYHQSARFDEEIELRVRVAKIGRSSMQFILEIHRAADHLITGEVIYVAATIGEHVSIPVPISIREIVGKHEGKSFAMPV